MKLSQEQGTGTHRIRNYQPGEVTINEDTYASSLVVMPETLMLDWVPETLEELTVEHLTAILELEPEVILLGTGTQQRFPERALIKEVIMRGVGLEIMDTAAACRTYNVLMAEDRRVAAALLLR